MMGAAEKADLYGVLGAAARRARRPRGMGDAARKRGPATAAGMDRRCPDGSQGVLVPDGSRGTAPRYDLVCHGDPGTGPRPGESTCDYRRRIGSPLVMFSGCQPRGMGDAASELRAIPLPGALERYLATGAPMGTLRRDLGAATAQIPRWAYGVGAGLAILIAARSYTKWRDEK